MSEREVDTWWHVESNAGGSWAKVGIRYDNLADAGKTADILRARHDGTTYRVVRIDIIREIEDEA